MLLVATLMNSAGLDSLLPDFQKEQHIPQLS